MRFLRHFTITKDPLDEYNLLFLGHLSADQATIEFLQALADPAMTQRRQPDGRRPSQ
jgi:hypothetical protein